MLGIFLLLEVPSYIKPNQEIKILSLISGYVQEWLDIDNPIKVGDVIRTRPVTPERSDR